MTPATPYAALLESPLETRQIGREIIEFDVVDSTNSYALEHGGNGTVYVADRQTAGRGRQGRTWHSAPGLGLWFTVALEGPYDGLSFAAALAVRDAIAPRAALTIKWPNDLLWNRKKICGILVEHRAGRTALGIGINVHHQPDDFPDELRVKAGSLESEVGGQWDRAVVLRDVLTALDRTIMMLRDGRLAEVHRAWADACNLQGRRIRTGNIEGTVLRIDGRGALIVQAADAQHTVHTGEIEFLDGN